MNLLIHIGLPKTGTTSLQSIFKKLDDEKHINYLNNYMFHDFIYLCSIEDYRFEKNILPIKKKLKLYLNTEKTNIISLEAITNSLYNHFSKTNKVSIKDKIQRFLTIADGLDVRVLFTIRNQPDLIESIYAQLISEGEKRTRREYHSFSEFVDGIIDERDYSEMFNYYDLIKYLQSKMDKSSIKVMTFESLNAEKRNYYEELFKYLNIAHLCNAYAYMNIVFNVTQKNKQVIISKRRSLKYIVRRRIKLLKARYRIDNIPSNKLIKYCTDLFYSFINKVNVYNSIKVQRLSLGKRNKILHKYLEGNKKIESDYNLSMEEYCLEYDSGVQ